MADHTILEVLVDAVDTGITAGDSEAACKRLMLLLQTFPGDLDLLNLRFSQMRENNQIPYSN